MARKPPPMSPWEAGQLAILAFDECDNRAEELRAAGFEALAEALEQASFLIGKAFNLHGSHEFGLPEEREVQRG